MDYKPQHQLCSGSMQTFTCNSTPNSVSHGWLIEETNESSDGFVSKATRQTVSSCEHSSTKRRAASVGNVLYKSCNKRNMHVYNVYAGEQTDRHGYLIIEILISSHICTETQTHELRLLLIQMDIHVLLMTQIDRHIDIPYTHIAY